MKVLGLRIGLYFKMVKNVNYFAGMAEPGGKGGRTNSLQILIDQLTLSQPGGGAVGLGGRL